jgi:hypothetical protein
MAFIPPVSAISGVGRPCASRRGDIALQQRGHFGGAGKHHAAYALIGGQLRATVSPGPAAVE